MGAVLLVVLVGCSQPAATRDDLAHALVESHSALVSGRLALETLHAGQTTGAAAETALQDMAQQAADAARALEPVTVGSSRDQQNRDLALAAITTGEAALLTARDELTDRGDADPAPLADAAAQIDRALQQVRGSR